VAEEQQGLRHRQAPAWKLSFTPAPTREFSSVAKVRARWHCLRRREGTALVVVG
jgi:hypothetical protein